MIFKTVCDVGDTHETVLISSSSNYPIEKDFLLLRGWEIESKHRIGRVKQVQQSEGVDSDYLEIIGDTWIDCDNTNLDEYMASVVSNPDSCQMITTIFDGNKVRIYILSR